MRSILVMNSKGGSGKTTLATNLAAFLANKKQRVALVDFDPQGSSLDWAAVRSEKRAAIQTVPGFEGRIRVARNTDVVIMDAPAAVHGKTLSELLRRAETVVMPVLPSPIDMRAARRFTDELMHLSRVMKQRIRLATVINRARESSPGRYQLEDYLRGIKLPDGHKLPLVGVLRASQNYIHAAEKGLGICEIAPSQAVHDLELWRPIMRWLNSKRSLPQG